MTHDHAADIGVSLAIVTGFVVERVADGVRLACSGRVVHLTAAQIAAINAAAANAP